MQRFRENEAEVSQGSSQEGLSLCDSPVIGQHVLQDELSGPLR